MTDYRTYKLRGKELRTYYIAAGSGLFLLGMLFYENLFFAAALAFFSLYFRRYYEEYLAEKRRRMLMIQFKDLLNCLSASFSVGRHLTEGLEEAYENLCLIYPDADKAPIVTEVEIMLRRLLDGREPEKEVLRDFADRSACSDIVNFVNMYFICAETGGDRIKAVCAAATQVIEKIEIRNEILVATAQKKFEAKLLSALPPFILLFLRLSSPDYLSVLYGNVFGFFVMTVSLAVMGLAFLWSTKITNIPV
jgi:tight adherence protein B